MRSNSKSLKKGGADKKHDANHKNGGRIHKRLEEPVEEVKPEKSVEQIDAENKIKFTLGLNKFLPASTKDDNNPVSKRNILKAANESQHSSI